MWDYNFEVEKEIDVKVDYEVDLEISTDPKLDSWVDVDHYYDVDVDIKGNDATWNIDIEALGDNTSVQLNLFVLVTDYMSSIITTGYAAVD
ncbi:hypothetical protein GCM10010964_27050 [Caldovatus sediminis]|uniref:Uncharacterized protein n=2 Tax=Caldovatus sediminis TaxID=2041189 RepID=A0A8J3ECZ7_9PROT|nr:hypothetical protein GCM10010964_27050 [Caldovatus sediminis]